MDKDIRELLIEFHQTFGIPVKECPEIPSDERIKLRARLIAEEFFEIITEFYMNQCKAAYATPALAVGKQTRHYRAYSKRCDNPTNSDYCWIHKNSPVRRDYVQPEHSNNILTNP